MRDYSNVARVECYHADQSPYYIDRKISPLARLTLSIKDNDNGHSMFQTY